MRPRLPSAAHARRAVELYRGGLSIAQTADAMALELGRPFSRRWVQVHVKRAGVLRSRAEGNRLLLARDGGNSYDLKAHWRRVRFETVRLRLEERLSYDEIAARLAVSRSSVRNWLARAGLTRGAREAA